MKVTFPAMKGKIGKREYYATVIALSEIPHLFKFNDWAECTPELRAQRVLNESRIPEIAHYILENEDGYLFSSITASYDCDLKFLSMSQQEENIGTIELDLEQAQFIINDGQHRCAAIAHALKQNPALGKEKISVLLFPMVNLHRLQQMFSDLNRFVHKTSKSLDILYDHRDSLSSLAMEVSEAVEVFRGMVDKERVTLAVRSPKLFTLSMLYDANAELFGGSIDKQGTPGYQAALLKAIDYWNELAEIIPDWKKVKEGHMLATQLRQEKINAHSVVIRALGALGKLLFEERPSDWKHALKTLKDIDWRKAKGDKVNPQWENVCMVAGSVVSNRQARAATLAALKQFVGVGLEKNEDRNSSNKKVSRTSKKQPQLV